MTTIRGVVPGWDVTFLQYSTSNLASGIMCSHSLCVRNLLMLSLSIGSAMARGFRWFQMVQV